MISKIGQRVYDIFVQLLLIIVGVLSALAVDNYRESVQEHRTERQYLIGLRNAVHADTAMLKNEIQRTYTKINAVSGLLRVANSTSTIDDEKFSNIVTDAIMLIRPNYLTAVYEELQFTGNFKLIQNNELKLAIISYYSDVAIIQRENEKNESYPAEVMKLLSLEELEFKVPFYQRRIFKAIQNNQKAREELLWSQKSTLIYRTAMIYTSLPKSIELLEKLQAEIDR